MNRPLRTSSAATFAVIASVLAGCAAPQSVSGGTTNFGGKVGDVGLATRALQALNSNRVPQAISLAEQAVAKSPNDAGFRALLGNAYFAAGRFRSAESAFKDSLALYPNQAQVVLKLALIEIALGKSSQAVALLDNARPALGESNYGLALALAGRQAEAIRVLEPVARGANSDPTVRQNLALAYAFAGNWDNARAIAAQDVPAGQIDARIQQWMQLANPTSASAQVAALVGVTPVESDAGQPVRLALVRPDVQLAEAPAPVAETSPAAAPPVIEAAASVAVPAPATAPQASAVRAAVPPAPPPPRPTMVAVAAHAVAEAKAAFASLAPHRAKPAMAKSSASAKRSVVLAAAPRRGNSPAVVQLGAYGSPDRVLAAWNGKAAKFGALKAYMPMSARFASPKGVFYRLSVRGFASDNEARELCSALRRQGASCFVRNSAGDQPVRYASR